MSRKPLFLVGVWIAVLLVVMPSGGLAAQETEQEEAPVSQGAPAVEVTPQQRVAATSERIPQATILTRADEAAARLRRLDAALEASDYLEQLTVQVDAQAARFNALESELDELDTRPVSLARIADVEAAWLRAQDAIDLRAADIQERWAGLRAELEELERMLEAWLATRATAEEQEYAAELVSRIDETIDGLEGMISRLEVVNDEAAALAGRISRQGAAVLRAFERLQAISDRLSRGLWVRGDTRMYSLLAGGERPDLAAELSDSMAYWSRSLAEYLDGREGNIYALATIFLVLLVAALWLRRLSRSWSPADETLADARAVVSRPLAMAVLFTAVSVRFAFADPARALQDGVVIVAVFGLLRLGPALLHRSLHRVLYAFTLIFVVNLPWQLLPGESVAGQWVLGFGIVVAVVCVAYVLYGFGAAREALGPRAWRLAQVGLILAELGFLLGLVAGGLGWLRLTRFLTAGFVSAVFAAIAWRVIYRAAVAILPFLVRAPLAHVREGSRQQEPLLRRVAALLIGLFVFYRYASSVLRDFRLLIPLRRWLEATLSETYAWGGLQLSVGSTLAAVVILILTPIAARVVRFVLREEVAPRVGLAPGVDYSVTTLAGYFVWVVGIAGAANAAGVSGTQMTVLFGALGVGLGFGLQAVVNNFVSGLILMFERPLKVGDRIQTATHAGTVTAIGIRSSNIRTWAGADVVVPNGDLITKEVINWTLSDDIRRVEVKVSTSYGTRPRQVIEVLHAVASEHPKVLAEPAPAAIMHSFGESALNFELRAWVEAGDFVSVGSELHVMVEERLHEAGIQLVVPRREIVVHSADPAEQADADEN